MSTLRRYLIAFGQFLLGLAGWLILSLAIIIAMPEDVDSEVIVPIVSFVVQLMGLGLAMLAIRRTLKWLGIGIICALILNLIGFVIFSRGCGIPGLPFPLRMILSC